MPKPQVTDFSGGIREHSFLIEAPLRNGLYPDERVPRNSGYAAVMKNLRPTPFGAVTPEAITNPITNGPTPVWTTSGTVQMFRGERNRWVMGQTQGYSATSAWVASAVGATFTASDVWQGVFFQELPFFTNSGTFLWGTSLSRVTTPTVAAVGKHQGRLLLGGLSGSVFSSGVFPRVFAQWKNVQTGDRLSYTAQAFDTGWIIFGERGGGSSDRPFDAVLSLLNMYGSTPQSDLESYLLSELERDNWGLCPLRYPGAMMAFHELGSGPLAFGQNGVAVLVPEGGTYRDERLLPIGIAGRGAVGGDLSECVFVDTNKEAWRIRSGSAPERLRFAPHLSTLTAANITVAFDPTERTYWISDKLKGYVLDSDGKLGGPLELFPTSLVRENGYLYGVVRDRRANTPITDIEFGTCTLDIAERGTKMATTFQVAREAISELQGGIDYRNVDLGNGAEGPRVQATASGAIHLYPRRSFVDARAIITGQVANGATGRLERVEFRYQAQDLTHKRGTSGYAQEAQ